MDMWKTLRMALNGMCDVSGIYQHGRKAPRLAVALGQDRRDLSPCGKIQRGVNQFWTTQVCKQNLADERFTNNLFKKEFSRVS
ncbi:hypothetical protein [Roseovarius nubinhibens]|uniref:hypothetical protein n=1 Tax=Roseovarius nubinhibens TaxID=314263 RepID=UPI0030EC2F57